MSTASDVLNQARGWLGTVEDPDGSNHCGITEHFADISGWEWCRSGNPWCDMSVSCWLTDAGLPTTFAYCPSHVNSFKRDGAWVDFDQAEPGDPVFFDWDRDGVADHVGLVEYISGDYAFTIEGNSGGGPAGDDGVWRHRRHRSVILGMGRPAYSDAPSVPAPEVPEAPVAGAESAEGSHPVLRVGSRGAGVTIWQQLLTINADGDFGPQTKSATVTFQANAKLEQDGIVGPATWGAMDQLLKYLAGGSQSPPEAPGSPVPPFPGTTRRGSRGDAVSQVQQRLADRGWQITVDGDFGAGTEAVVRSFQHEKGLEVDGVVGPETWTTLWTAPVN